MTRELRLDLKKKKICKRFAVDHREAINKRGGGSGLNNIQRSSASRDLCDGRH